MAEQELDDPPAPPRLPLAEASARLGKSVDAVRAMIRRGKLATTRGNDGRLLVAVPPELVVAPASANEQDRLGADQSLARLQTERDEALAEAEHWRVEAHAQELARVRAQAEAGAKDVLIEELRSLLAEARKPWWLRMLGR